MSLDSIIKDPLRLLSGSEIPEFYKRSHQNELLDVHAVAYPTNRSEVVALVRYANEKELSIVTYGANTGLSDATTVFGGELIIDLSKMNRIIEFDEETLTVTVEPGVTNGEIQEFVESKGYFYPPDPRAKQGLSEEMSLQMPEVCEQSNMAQPVNMSVKWKL
ncbi:FAD-binding oxidoreductase [Aerococcaceae bacterium WGS1372]